MNIKVNGTFVSILTAVIVQAAGIIFFISSLSSTVENNNSRIARIESSIIEISAAIESLDKSITLMHDQQKNINSEHKMLFEKTNLYDGVYTPAESRKY
jgi:peptidoglycan hydrolase CwlO-like protein